MTSTTDTQIKLAFEKENMTPAQIAIDLSLDETAVKAKLMQISSIYRKACGAESPEEEELNFSNEQLKHVNAIIYETAISAEDPHLRFKAATYVRDDKKGRKEVVRSLANGSTFNILNFNESLKEARQAMANIANKTIDVKAA